MGSQKPTADVKAHQMHSKILEPSESANQASRYATWGGGDFQLRTYYSHPVRELV